MIEKVKKEDECLTDYRVTGTKVPPPAPLTNNTLPSYFRKNLPLCMRTFQQWLPIFFIKLAFLLAFKSKHQAPAPHFS